MTIYLLVDDNPARFGGLQIKRAFKSKKKALQALERWRKRDSYDAQYAIVWATRVF